jgi:hypothetical protein|tara:strand:- start:7631 stop:7921 length:291 start_codon:yes stop_codon:yes gene_type:complete
MNREQRRAAAKNAKKAKKNNTPELEEKIALFGKLPNECLTCQKPFDKKDKKQVMSWSVVVRNDTEEVRLYCPDCWSKAKAVVQAYEKEHGYGKPEE